MLVYMRGGTQTKGRTVGPWYPNDEITSPCPYKRDLSESVKLYGQVPPCYAEFCAKS